MGNSNTKTITLDRLQKINLYKYNLEKYNDILERIYNKRTIEIIAKIYHTLNIEYVDYPNCTIRELLTKDYERIFKSTSYDRFWMTDRDGLMNINGYIDVKIDVLTYLDIKFLLDKIDEIKKETKGKMKEQKENLKIQIEQRKKELDEYNTPVEKPKWYVK